MDTNYNYMEDATRSEVTFGNNTNVLITQSNREWGTEELIKTVQANWEAFEKINNSNRFDLSVIKDAINNLTFVNLGTKSFRRYGYTDEQVYYRDVILDYSVLFFFKCLDNNEDSAFIRFASKKWSYLMDLAVWAYAEATDEDPDHDWNVTTLTRVVTYIRDFIDYAEIGDYDQMSTRILINAVTCNNAYLTNLIRTLILANYKDADSKSLCNQYQDVIDKATSMVAERIGTDRSHIHITID